MEGTVREWTHLQNCFRDDNRSVRKRGLQTAQKELVGKDINIELIKDFLSDPAATELMKLISDPIEIIREKTAEIINSLLEHIRSEQVEFPMLKSIITTLIPIVGQRIGQNTVVEQAEEIRLLLIKILHHVIAIGSLTAFMQSDNQRPASLTLVYVDEILQILEKAIVDQYPEVKKEACHCTRLLAVSLPRGYFPEKSACLIKPLLQSVSHQHYRVRALVVETIGDVIMHGSGKSVPDVISHLAQRLFDQSPLVRSAVIKVVGNWLLDLADRYSFHYQLMPLLLTGLNDELDEIKEEADCLWHDIGIKYHRENEDELKDAFCFGDQPPAYYPENLERPPLGCRMLMYHHVSKILPAGTRDLGDWVVETRIKASQLLYYLVLNSEMNCTQHLEMLLTAFYKACKDDEIIVRQNALKSAELAGRFIPAENWCRVILPRLDIGSPEILMTMAALIRGSHHDMLIDHLDIITEKISCPELCQTVTPQVQKTLIDLLEALVEVAGDDIKPYGSRVFEVAITVLALQTGPLVNESTTKFLIQLSKHGYSDTSGLFETYTRSLLEKYGLNCDDWNLYSVEAKIFSTLLLESDTVAFANLDVAMPIFKANLDVDKNPELRVNLFTLMSKMITKACEDDNLKEMYGQYVNTIVNEILLPNLVWKAGRTAAAVRSSAIASLWCFMKLGLGEIGQLFTENEQLIPKILPMLREDARFSRLVTCKVLKSIFYTYADKNVEHLSSEFLKALLAILQVLDDSANEIRIAGCETMRAYLECFKNRPDTNTYSGHIEEMINGLLIHLDDPVAKVEESVAAVLRELAILDAKQLKDKLKEARGKHRNVRPCDELIEYVDKLTV